MGGREDTGAVGAPAEGLLGMMFGSVIGVGRFLPGAGRSGSE
jgi:hypothetical protein